MLFFFHQAVRKEQRFKAIHKSNRAAEKIVKTYLKAKALETVTKRKRYFKFVVVLKMKKVLTNKGSYSYMYIVKLVVKC